jgi:hypothetical protein
VGLIAATSAIQIDRYSRISDKGIHVAFLDSTNTFKGWKTKFQEPNAWVQYNAVKFGPEKLKSVELSVLSPKGGTLQIRLDKPDGQIISEVKIPKTAEWKSIVGKISKVTPGVHNLFITLKDSPVEVDWVKFK